MVLGHNVCCILHCHERSFAYFGILSVHKREALEMYYSRYYPESPISAARHTSLFCQLNDGDFMSVALALMPKVPSVDLNVFNFQEKLYYAPWASPLSPISMVNGCEFLG